MCNSNRKAAPISNGYAAACPSEEHIVREEEEGEKKGGKRRNENHASIPTCDTHPYRQPLIVNTATHNK